MCLLNEEPVSGAICLTEATIDNEIVSKKKNLLLFALPLDPFPTLKKHTHIKPYMRASFDPILAL